MKFVTVALALLAAACSSRDARVADSAAGEVNDTAVQGAFVISLAEWKVESPMDTLPAGRYTFRVENTGTEKHGFEIEGNGREWETGDLEPGTASEITVNLEPGTYEVYCPVESHGKDHDDRGMKRKLVVKP